MTKWEVFFEKKESSLAEQFNVTVGTVILRARGKVAPPSAEFVERREEKNFGLCTTLQEVAAALVSAMKEIAATAEDIAHYGNFLKNLAEVEPKIAADEDRLKSQVRALAPTSDIRTPFRLVDTGNRIVFEGAFGIGRSLPIENFSQALIACMKEVDGNPRSMVTGDMAAAILADAIDQGLFSSERK